MAHGSLDEISVAIGGLQEGMKNLVAMQERIFNEIKGNKSETETQLEKHAKDIESLKNFRNRLYGIAGTASFISTALAEYIRGKAHGLGL